LESLQLIEKSNAMRRKRTFFFMPECLSKNQMRNEGTAFLNSTSMKGWNSSKKILSYQKACGMFPQLT